MTANASYREQWIRTDIDDIGIDNGGWFIASSGGKLHLLNGTYGQWKTFDGQKCTKVANIGYGSFSYNRNVYGAMRLCFAGNHAYYHNGFDLLDLDKCGRQNMVFSNTPSSIFSDAKGDLYALGLDNGDVWKLDGKAWKDAGVQPIYRSWDLKCFLSPCFDAEGNIYATARRDKNENESEIVLIKYTPNGGGWSLLEKTAINDRLRICSDGKYVYATSGKRLLKLNGDNGWTVIGESSEGYSFGRELCSVEKKLYATAFTDEDHCYRDHHLELFTNIPHIKRDTQRKSIEEDGAVESSVDAPAPEPVSIPHIKRDTQRKNIEEEYAVEGSVDAPAPEPVNIPHISR
ncbi:hypothetical protein FACS1894122_08110 [Alphaproteobacteria bacterium]|nr:hypothetical protein FACS1894122_08110 [Alphaproteobacteria bacterium]